MLFCFTFANLACTNGELRLAGGNTLTNGRVEICRDQQWGTVCDNGWEGVDANVVCRQLGYSGLSKLLVISCVYM